MPKNEHNSFCTNKNCWDIPDSLPRNPRKVSREGTNFLTTTPFTWKNPPPHPAIFGPDKLISVLFCFFSLIFAMFKRSNLGCQSCRRSNLAVNHVHSLLAFAGSSGVVLGLVLRSAQHHLRRCCTPFIGVYHAFWRDAHVSSHSVCSNCAGSIHELHGTYSS